MFSVDFDDGDAWDDVTRGEDDWDKVFLKAKAQEKELKSSSGLITISN